MLYIGFSNYSHKLHAKIFCNKYKHCAPVIINNTTVIIYQFVCKGKITQINIQKTDLETLKRHGWIFIRYKKHINPKTNAGGLTCVQFTKKVCGINNIMIQTPFALFKYLQNK